MSENIDQARELLERAKEDERINRAVLGYSLSVRRTEDGFEVIVDGQEFFMSMKQRHLFVSFAGQLKIGETCTWEDEA